MLGKNHSGLNIFKYSLSLKKAINTIPGHVVPAPTSLLHSQTRAQHTGEGKMEHAPELHLLLQLTPQKPSHPGAVRVFTSTADPWPGEMPLLPHRNFMKPPL